MFLFLKRTELDNLDEYNIFLTRFSPMFHFYTPWKRHETKGLLAFSGVIEMEHWAEMG